MKKVGIILQTLLMLLSWLLIEVFSFIGALVLSKNKKNKTALLLAFALPPASNSGTHRPLSLIKTAPECDWNLTAISDPIDNEKPSKAGLFLSGQIPENTEITRYKPVFKTTSWQLTPQIDGGFPNVIALVFHAIKQHWRNKPSLVIASGPPFYLAIAGMYLARLFGAKLVLDYRDEWTLCPFEFVSKTVWDKWFEKRCVRAADKIVYTTQPHMLSHKAAFNIPDSKLTLIPNGWDEALSVPSTSSPTTYLDPQKLNISYIGKLSKHCDPSAFLNDLRTILEKHPDLKNKLSINFVGPKHPETKQILENFGQKYSVINIIDEVVKSDAISIMQRSDYLLMLCEKRLASYIPGKLYDYLSTYSPIIIHGHEGEVSRIVKLLSAGAFVDEGNDKALEKLLLNKTDLVSKKYVANWLVQHTRKKLALEFFNSINKL